MPNNFNLKLSRLGSKTNEIAVKVLKVGGEIALEEVRKRLSAVTGLNIKGKRSRSTGELFDSLGVSPADIDRKGIINIKIGFNEPRKNQYNAKGKRSYYTITNAMIANVLEHGKKDGSQVARPFMEPAKKACEKACRQAMQKKFDEEVEKL